MSAIARTALLDIDGTLLDSNDAHTRCWVDVLQRHGHDVPYHRVRPLIGKGGDKLLTELLGFDDSSPQGKQIADERRALFLRVHLPQLQPTRGARTLLQRLKREGWRLIVATSAGGEELDSLLLKADVKDLVDEQATSDDADNSKPDPDIVQAALDRAGATAESALMLGDTPFDVEAAQAAGVKTVALRCGGWWSDTALAGAVAIYDDPAALLERLAESPFATPGAAHPQESNDVQR